FGLLASAAFVDHRSAVARPRRAQAVLQARLISIPADAGILASGDSLGQAAMIMRRPWTGSVPVWERLCTCIRPAICSDSASRAHLIRSAAVAICPRSLYCGRLPCQPGPPRRPRRVPDDHMRDTGLPECAGGTRGSLTYLFHGGNHPRP